MGSEDNGSTKPEPKWPDLHRALIDDLVKRGSITDRRVEAAFRSVPRHLFLPGTPVEQAYRDAAITTKQADGKPISSSSQPAVVALMLAQLGLERGQHVLEIGAGTGYNAALMAYLVGEEGKVTTIDIDEDLVEQGRSNLAAAGIHRVNVVCADGGFGYAAGAPYDRIVLTVGSADIAPAWIEQLKAGGRLLVPISFEENGVAKSIAFQRAGECLESISIKDCGFIMLRGQYEADGPGPQTIGPKTGLQLYLTLDSRDRVDGATLYNLLKLPYRDASSKVPVTGNELATRFMPWLTLQTGLGQSDAIGSIAAVGDAAGGDLIPFLFGMPGRFHSTLGLIGADNMAVLMQPPGDGPHIQVGDETPFELYVRGFGEDARLMETLMDWIREWDSAGRPPDPARLKIKACPKTFDFKPKINQSVIEKPNMKFLIEW